MKFNLNKIIQFLVLFLTFSELSLAFTGQPTITLPIRVEPGENFTITWTAGDGHDDDFLVLESKTTLQRQSEPNVWVDVYEVDNSDAGSYVDNVVDPGVYSYRMKRVDELFDDATYGQDTGEEDPGTIILSNYEQTVTRIDFPITITIASFEQGVVLCLEIGQQDCLSIDTPQGLNATVFQDEKSANLVWLPVSNSSRYELEVFDFTYNQWTILYDGGDLNYTAESLDTSETLFRVKACLNDFCGQPSLATSVYIEPVNITSHQCEAEL